MIKTGQVYRLLNGRTKFCVGQVRKDQIIEMHTTNCWIRPVDLQAYYRLDVLDTFKELIKRNK